MVTRMTTIDMTTRDHESMQRESKQQESMQALEKRLDLRDRQLHTVHEVSSALASQTDLTSILRETLRVSLKTVARMPGPCCCIMRRRANWCLSTLSAKRNWWA